MNTETWLPVRGWEGFYEVSDHGRVRSVDRTMTRMLRGKLVSHFKKGIIRKTPLNHYGYPNMSLCRRGHKMVIGKVHRLVADAFLGPIPPGMDVNHKDGRPTNNHVSNLEICTRSHNQLHRHWVLGQDRGESHWNCRLKESDVRKILKLIERGTTQKEIAKIYGVTRVAISQINQGRTWNWLTGRLPAPSFDP